MPLKKIILLPNLFKTLSISCSNKEKRGMVDQFSELTQISGNVVFSVTHMATKLSSNPIRPGLDVKEIFAGRFSGTVIPGRNWKYALLIVSTCGHDHLCAGLQLLHPDFNQTVARK